MLIAAWRPMVVLVRAYTRFRFGRVENVRRHYRGFPNSGHFA